jgi:hypothetical protein
MNMNMLGKLVLAGVLTAVSVPAMAHGRDHKRGHRHGDRCGHHDRDRGDRFRDRDHERGAVWVAPAPVRREVWVPGHWSRRGHGRVWIEASWAMPPQPSWVWISPQWVWTGVTWQWQEGHWTARS